MVAHGAFRKKQAPGDLAVRAPFGDQPGDGELPLSQAGNPLAKHLLIRKLRRIKDGCGTWPEDSAFEATGATVSSETLQTGR